MERELSKISVSVYSKCSRQSRPFTSHRLIQLGILDDEGIKVVVANLHPCFLVEQELGVGLLSSCSNEGVLANSVTANFFQVHVGKNYVALRPFLSR